MRTTTTTLGGMWHRGRHTWSGTIRSSSTPRALSPYVGKTYDEHAAHASAIMGHDTDIHEQTYLPVSPSHQTRDQELAAAARAEPLDDAVAAAAAAATGSSSGDSEYDEY